MSKLASRSKAQASSRPSATATDVVGADAPPRQSRTYRLADIDIAPENLRAGQPADEAVDQLAETILAAGLLQPITVRPGRGSEARAAMALDGRRRLLALRRLREAGRIGDDYPVPAFVETDPARQVAAVVLTNTAAPVHVADVIVAVGRMLKAGLGLGQMAAALGYAEIELRRMAALADLHPAALDALRQGRLTLRQARLLARLPDRQVQGEIAQAALDGFGFQEWRAAELLDAERLTTDDPRFAVVGPARYASAGGRVEADLFGERAGWLQDPDLLHALWRARATEIAAPLGDGERQVRLGDARADEPEGLDRIGFTYGYGLEPEALAAWRAADAAAEAAAGELQACDLAGEAGGAALAVFLAARLKALEAGAPGRAITHVVVVPSPRTGLDLRAYGPPLADPDEALAAVEADPEDASGDEVAPSPAPLAEAAAPAVEGVGHGLHALRTDLASRVLARALVDAPRAAEVVLVARLFSVLVLEAVRPARGGALALTADAYLPKASASIAALDGEVLGRLAARQAAWAASGATPIAWVHGLADADRAALLAELVALSLDLREPRTTGLRGPARGEAAEIEHLCGVAPTAHWTPDATFFAAHSKPELQAMLAEMGERAGAPGARKDQLVERAVRAASDRRWAPSCLSWRAATTAQAGDAPTP